MILEIFSSVIIMVLLNLVRLLFLKNTNLNILSCGLTGFSGKSQSNTDKLALLMYHNSVKRGEDNTGFYTPDEGVKKDNKKAEEFLAENIIPKSHLFIGHVRRGSVGGKLAVCSHPFEFENIVLVHNGTLTNHWNLVQKSEYKHGDFNVDSEILAKFLDDNTKSEDGLFTTLSEYEGAAALLFTDKRDPNQLYAYTNGERPLFYGFISGSMYLSSTEESLKLIGCRDIKECKKDYVYSIKLGKIIGTTYYAPKEKPVNIIRNRNHQSWNQKTQTWENLVSQCSNNDCNIEDYRVSNVSLKNGAMQDYLKNSPKSEDFINRWVRASYSYCTQYGEITNKPSITVGEWYYIYDACAGNSYDLMFVDDEDNEVYLAKYQFDWRSLNFTDKYAVAMAQIESKTDVGTLFIKGEFVELSSNDISKESTLECYHEPSDTSYTTPTEFLRPVTERERDKIISLIVEKQNTPIILPAPSTDTSVRKLSKTDEEAYDEFMRVANMQNRKIVDEPGEAPFDSEINESSVTEEIIASFVSEPDEALASHILDGIEDKLDNLQETVDVIEVNELKEGFTELRDFVNHAYNFKKIKEDLQLVPKD